MYAHLYPADRGPDGSSQASTGAASPPGLLGSITFRQLAGPADVCLTRGTPRPGRLRQPRSELAAPRRDLPGHRGQGRTSRRAAAGLRPPDVLRRPAGTRTGRRGRPAGRDQWPAIQGLTGLTGIYVLQASDLGAVVITLATSIEALDPPRARR